MILAYPGQASVWPGGTLALHVSTDSPRFRVAFHRWGDGPQLMSRSAWLPGRQLDARAADADWDWPAHAFAIPAGWPSGVYLAMFEEAGQPRSFDLARDDGAALFVVRGSGGGLLYKLPLATYHAYNRTGGGCFYDNPPRSGAPPGARVSLRRPGGGIGGEVWGAPDHYDAGSPRQSFAHWDARFIRWLSRNGYAADFCTDLDIHADPGLLGRYRLLVSSGHDEYWSEATRDAVEAFADAGGNLAFFGANLCWWRIHIVDDGAAMVCHQGGPQGARDHWWPPTGAARPEDSLGGASYRHGGGWWDGPRRTTGYLIQQPGHWVFAGTGLARGEALGRDTWPPLVGYECDGAPLASLDARDGAVLAAWALEAGTPPGYEVLAAAPLGPGWQELPPRERPAAGHWVSSERAGDERAAGTAASGTAASGAAVPDAASAGAAGSDAAGPGLHAATLGVFQRMGSGGNGIGSGGVKGTVFSSGTTDWAQVLGTARDRRVERITRNVLDTLLRA